MIHAAAYTDVDGCEVNRDLAFAVNEQGTRNVALACRDTGALMIYYSTDYVFDGTSAEPYTEGDQPAPATIYGQSKLAGERAMAELLEESLIIRIGWLYGAHGRNFLKTILKFGIDQLAAKDRGEAVVPLRVVVDQFGSPTWTVEIVRQTSLLLGSELRGIVHATSEGETSWYDFACDIFASAGRAVQVDRCTTAEYPRLAPRPIRSTLENNRLKVAGLNLMSHYRDALRDFWQRHGLEMI